MLLQIASEVKVSSGTLDDLDVTVLATEILGDGALSYDPNCVTPEMVAGVAQFSEAMDTVTSGGYPNASGLVRLIRFVTGWVELGASLTELDSTASIPRPEWLEVLKEATSKDEAEKSGVCGLARFMAFLRAHPYPLGATPTSSDETGASHPIQILRAAVAQGAYFRVTHVARKGLESGDYAPELVGNAEDVLAGLSSMLFVMRRCEIEEALGELYLELTRKRAFGANTSTEKFIRALPGLLNPPTCGKAHFGTTRFKKTFPLLMNSLCGEGQTRSPTEQIATLEKLVIIMAGKTVFLKPETDTMVVVPVLDQGQTWIPGRKYSARLRRTFGRLVLGAMRKMFLLDYMQEKGEANIALFDGTWDYKHQPRTPFKDRE